MPIIKFPSEWLKANVNCKQGSIIRFLTSGLCETDKRGGAMWTFKVAVINPKTNEVAFEKKFSLNKTNFNAISAVYGANSDKWVGKEMKVNVGLQNNPTTGQQVPAIFLVSKEAVDGGEPSDEEIFAEEGTTQGAEEPVTDEEIPF